MKSHPPPNDVFLASLVNALSDAILSTNLEGVITSWNRGAEHLFGHTASAAIGQPISTLLPSRASNEDLEIRARITRGERMEDHMAVRRRKNGSEISASMTASPIELDRRIVGVAFMFRDASERRAAENAAWWLAAIIEGSDDAIVGKDLNGVVTSWNPAAERIFGYTAEEMIGKSITILHPPDRLTEEQLILARLQQGERMDHFQTQRVRKDGALIHVSLTISPIRDNQGRVIGASKIARDITELKIAHENLEMHASHLEDKVRERTAKLEGMVSELETLSYSLSHDMRAPLRAIQSFTEIVLADYGKQIPEGTEYLRKVISAANRMDRLIRDVLSFARISRSEINVVPLDVDKLVHDIIHERPELHPPRATVTVRSPLLPVLGHDASLTQCLTNLLDNAVKFVGPGVSPRVDVHTRRVGDRVRICVRDNGIGINPEGQRKLFGIFQRLHTNEQFEGTGVGLAIVRKAAERMNGTAGLESAEGQGSTFWIELAPPQP